MAAGSPDGLAVGVVGVPVVGFASPGLLGPLAGAVGAVFNGRHVPRVVEGLRILHPGSAWPGAGLTESMATTPNRARTYRGMRWLDFGDVTARGPVIVMGRRGSP